MLSVACGTGSPSNSLVPGASTPPTGRNCSSVNIVTPSGADVQLTGTWRADDQGRYDILQRESCLYWLGMSQDVGFGAGDIWTNVFTATIRPDFTIVGDWGDVPFNPAIPTNYFNNGSLVLRIDFDETGEVERPVLRRVAESGDFGGGVWVLEESLSDPVELVGTFGGDEERQCVWVEADGERTELVGSGAWTIRDQPLSVQDESGHIAARVGDPIVVRGQLSAVLGGRCTDTSILVEELDPTP
jgi:hypothetical protein